MRKWTDNTSVVDDMSSDELIRQISTTESSEPSRKHNYSLAKPDAQKLIQSTVEMVSKNPMATAAV